MRATYALLFAVGISIVAVGSTSVSAATCLAIPLKLIQKDPNAVEEGANTITDILAFERSRNVVPLQPTSGYVSFVQSRVLDYDSNYPELSKDRKWQVLQSYYCTFADPNRSHSDDNLNAFERMIATILDVDLNP